MRVDFLSFALTGELNSPSNAGGVDIGVFRAIRAEVKGLVGLNLLGGGPGHGPHCFSRRKGPTLKRPSGIPLKVKLGRKTCMRMYQELTSFVLLCSVVSNCLLQARLMKVQVAS